MRDLLASKHRAELKAEVYLWPIEKDADRAAHLESLIEARKPSLPPRCRVTVVTGVFDETITKVFDTLDARGTKLAPPSSWWIRSVSPALP